MNRPQIGARVRAVHLSHFCPGAAGFPVTSPNSASLNLDRALAVAQPWLLLDDHTAYADGEICDRCAGPIAVGQEARRIGGVWVHANCPARQRLR